MRSIRNSACDWRLEVYVIAVRRGRVSKSITRIVLWGAGIALIGCLIWWLAPKYFQAEADPRSREFLSKLAADINRQAPVMIDAETELLPVVGADGILIYNYRLVRYAVAQLDSEKFHTGAKERLTRVACSTAETRDGLLKKGVTLRYAYFDRDRQHIATVDVRPSDCGF
jgi:hypothetical protein